MEDMFFIKRIQELAARSDHAGKYFSTGFLGMSEISAFHGMKRSLAGVPYTLWGGAEGCERQVLRFGSPEFCGYEEPFPITVLEICPLSKKFSEELSHRDVLGTVMGLGIERETIGDIRIRESGILLFCLTSMADYIRENLTRIRHTSVTCRVWEGEVSASEDTGREVRLPVASERADLLVAKLINLSRGDAAELFERERVFVNGRLQTSGSHALREGDVVTVRGFGRFIYLGTDGVSKKGKTYVKLMAYGMEHK